MSVELALVERCLSGEVAAQLELVRRFELDVLRLCTKLLRDRHEAEDVAQEVFLRVFRSLHRWDRARPLKPWVLTITVNRCRTALGKRMKRPTTADYLAELPQRSPMDSSAELVQAVAGCVAELRQDYREVFVLYHETGHNYEEIAEIVGRPVGTVKTWLHRARLLLSAALTERGLLPSAPLPSTTQP